MNGIEKITGRILADVEAETQALLAEAKANADEIAAGYADKAKAQTAAILARGEANADQRKERLASMAGLEGRKLTLAAKQELVEAAFDGALKQLTGLEKEMYIALLADLCVKACRTGKEEVIFSRKDRDAVGAAVVAKANEKLAKAVAPKLPDSVTETRAGAVLDKVVTAGAALLNGTGMLTVSQETREMAGGLVLKDEDVETNCSFEVMLHLRHDELANEVAKLLFD